MSLENFKNRKIEWDTVNKNFDQSVQIVSGDVNSRTVTIVITDNGEPINLTGYSVKLIYKYVYNDISGFVMLTPNDASKGEFSLTIPTEMTVPGSIKSNLILLNENFEQVIVSKNLKFISDDSTVTDLAQEVNSKIDDFTKLLLESMPQVMRSELNDLHAQTESNTSNIELKANSSDMTSLQSAMNSLQNKVEAFGITPENLVTIKSLLDAIANNATDSEVAELINSVNVLTSNISLMSNGDYSPKANKTDLESLQSAVNNQSATISTKANQTDLDNLQTTVTSQGVAISTKAEQAEIVQARGGQSSLDARLDGLDAKDTDLQNQINVNKASINTTNSIVNNLVATAGNGNSSELPDMRVATNGAIFDTAGNAERTQINILYNELDDISIKSTNIFDKKKFKPNTYISYSNGIEIANSKYSASDFIFIKPNTTYYTNFIDQLAFYDSQKKYISGESLNRQTNTMVSPSNAVYLRLTVPTAKLDAFQINEGSALLSYSEGGRKIGIGSFEQSLKNKIALFDSNYKVSSNLFDKRTALNKYYINYTTGALTIAPASPETWFASDWISIEPSTNYTTKYSQWIAYYDINKVYISGLGIGHATTFTSPANAYFLRLSTKNNEIDSEQLNKGGVLSNYDVGGVIRNYQDGNPLVKPSSIFYDAISHPKGARPRIKLIGDSITAGAGATGFAEDGDKIVDSGHKMSIDDNSWSKQLKTLLNTLNIDVINWGISGWNSGQIISNISKLSEDSDDLVILQIGTNDRHNFPSYQSTYNNILGIVQYLRRRGIPCILMSAIPATVSGDNDAIRNYGMFEVNYAIGKCAFNSGMDYISNYDALLNYEELTGRNLDEFIGDGLHPNDLGYAYMFKNITRHLGLSYRRDGIIPKNN